MEENIFNWETTSKVIEFTFTYNGGEPIVMNGTINEATLVTLEKFAEKSLKIDQSQNVVVSQQELKVKMFDAVFKQQLHKMNEISNIQERNFYKTQVYDKKIANAIEDLKKTKAQQMADNSQE